MWIIIVDLVIDDLNTGLFIVWYSDVKGIQLFNNPIPIVKRLNIILKELRLLNISHCLGAESRNGIKAKKSHF